MALDIDAILNGAVMGIWGEPVIFTPLVSDPGAPPFVGRGIFDEAHEIVLEQIAASELTAAGHSTTAPVLEVRLSEFQRRPRIGDQVEVRSRQFSVWDVRPDGAGHADLILREVV